MARPQLGAAPSRPGDALVFNVVRTPEQYGAVGDGTTNDQAALLAMLAALKPGDTVRMPGQYRHSAELTVPVKDTTWFWTGALLATNRLAASLRISTAAEGTTMYGARHIVDPWDGTGDARTGSDISTAPFAIYDTSRITMVDAYSANSAQCGFYLSTVKGYRFVRPVVDRSFADGFHQTHNCEDGTVDDPTVMWPGDDGVAVVSYLTRGSGGAAVDPCRRIIVRRPVVRYTHARGLSAVGGTDITYLDVDVFHTRGAGIYIGSESGFNTHPAVRCEAIGGEVRHVGYGIPPSGSTTDDAPLDHGPLFLLTQQAATPVVDCGYSDIEVSDVGVNVLQYGRAVTNNGATFSGCFYRRITVQPGPEKRSGGVLGIFGATSGVTYDTPIDNRAVAAAATAAQAVKARLASNATAVNNTAGLLSWTGTDEVDTNDLHSTSTNPTRLTVKVDGLYRVEAFISFAQNGTGTRHVYMTKNTDSNGFLDEIRSAVSTHATRISTGTVLPLVAGDYVTVGVFQTSGSNLAIEATLSSFAMYRVA